MIRSYLAAIGCLLGAYTFGQTTGVQQLNQVLPPATALSPLRFLASDELMGRGTTRPEIHIAARYISEQFRSLGLKEVAGTKDYFQSFTFKIVPSSNGTLMIGDRSFELGKDLVLYKGEGLSAQTMLVYGGFGTEEDLQKIDVKGKIILEEIGVKDTTSGFMEGLQSITEKQKRAADRGAVAIILRFRDAGIPWEPVLHHFAADRLVNEKDHPLPVFILNDRLNGAPLSNSNPAQASLTMTGAKTRTVPAENVMGYIEGTDPKLKDQFIVLTSHYDHVGVAPHPKMEEGKLDSIYNGARDNAIGTTAVIDAARYFSQNRPKRSILFITYTGEEMGLIGSRYFAAHPAMPLNKLVYNLNIDNASYNDTTIITVVGLGRTSADEDIKKGAAAYGLTAIADPAPEQNLFDRSDNVSLAAKGIPAPTYSLGIRKFDENITNRYHQLSDEVGNLNLNYVMKFITSFIVAAQNIANNPVLPKWNKGDKYESAWNALFQKSF